MMLERGVILPNANFREMNPEIEGHDRIKVRIEGFGGSNAAILLEEGPGMLFQRDCILTNGDNTGANGSDPHRLVDGVRHKKPIENGASVESKADSDKVTTSSSYLDNGMGKLLYVFSAQSLHSLEAYLPSFTEYLGGLPRTTELDKNLAFTLSQRKTHFAHRVAVVLESTASLKE
ncbi:MAG: hypothetical protein Q9196_001425 [Gyalolechia fulgens]